MKRNLALDYLKVLLSLMVIAIHVGVLHKNNSFIVYLLYNGFCRVAVPLFFVVNGYFLSKIIIDNQKVIVYLKKILVLYLVWSIIYLPFYIHEHKIIIPILFGYHHLWYLSGLVFATIVLWFLLRKNINLKIVLLLSLFLFLIGFILQKYNVLYPKTHIGDILKATFISRNFIFLGFPFVFLGYYLSRIPLDSFKSIDNLRLYLLLLLSIVLLFIEVFLDYKLDINKGSDFVISTLLLCPVVFVIFIRQPIIAVKSDLFSKISTAIYLIHPLLIAGVIILFPAFGFWQLFAMVAFCSVLAGLVLMQLNKWVKILLV